ncbi:hypothetical protein [Streptomyces virginiae]|uniref:Ferredoxin n=1 Tax=Streptomyces virginiae TaxID=1961 RepID=A0ABZ1TE46_STRVG|nr:hypothetical protein [Streptomyces virginiae]
MTEPSSPIDDALRAQAERAKCTCRFDPRAEKNHRPWCNVFAGPPAAEQPVRHTADTITDDDLDQLYARAEQAEAAIARVRAAHLETADGRCSDCLVSWPCPDVCRLDGPPGCRNCDEYHSRPA